MTTDYNSFIEIFTGINIAYAGSTDFRDLIDTKILKISLSFIDLEERLDSLANNISLFRYFPFPQERQIRKKVLLQRIKNRILDDRIKMNTQCVGLFKSAFLCSGLYCLVFLVCSASMVQDIHVKESKTILLLTSIIIGVYNIFVFIHALINPRKKIMAVWPVLIMLSTIIISIIIARFNCTIHIEKFMVSICKPFIHVRNEERKYFIYIVLLIAILPIILHVLRSLIMFFYTWIRKLWLRWKLRAIDREAQKIAGDRHQIPIRDNFRKKVFLGLILIWIDHRIERRETDNYRSKKH